MSEQTVVVPVPVPGAIINLNVPAVPAKTALDAAYARYQRAQKKGTPLEQVLALSDYCNMLEAIFAAYKIMGQNK